MFVNAAYEQSFHDSSEAPLDSFLSLKIPLPAGCTPSSHVVVVRDKIHTLMFPYFPTAAVAVGSLHHIFFLAQWELTKWKLGASSPLLIQIGS